MKYSNWSIVTESHGHPMFPVCCTGHQKAKSRMRLHSFKQGMASLMEDKIEVLEAVTVNIRIIVKLENAFSQQLHFIDVKVYLIMAKFSRGNMIN